MPNTAPTTVRLRDCAKWDWAWIAAGVRDITERKEAEKRLVAERRRAETLINDILDLSKIESGRFELEFVDFGLADLVERTMELMASRESAKNIELTTQIISARTPP
jgi:signal transduction histidine kinase